MVTAAYAAYMRDLYWGVRTPRTPQPTDLQEVTINTSSLERFKLGFIEAFH